MPSSTDFPSAGQPSPLLIDRLLDRPRTWAPDQKIIYRDIRELSYLEFFERVERLAQGRFANSVSAQAIASESWIGTATGTWSVSLRDR